MIRGDFAASGFVPSETEVPIFNARLIAELQAVTLAIHLVGLERLPEVMRPLNPFSETHA